MNETSDLRRFVVDYFNDEELENLTFDFFPDVSENYALGMTKGQKVRELLGFALRHDRLPHLLVALEKLRPEAFRQHLALDMSAAAEAAEIRHDPGQLFISHAKLDAALAAQLAADLRAAGFRTWLAAENILPGEKWVEAIDRGLRESGVFLLLLTPAAVSSEWVEDEVSVAIALENEGEARLFLLDVQEADVPPLWSIRQFVSFREDYARGRETLISLLRGQSVSPVEPVRVLARPPAAQVQATRIFRYAISAG